MSDITVNNQKERKRKLISVLVAVAVHLGIVLLCIWINAWVPPNPPPPELGIEVDFGDFSMGSAKIENDVQANDNEALEEASIEEIIEEEEVPVEETEEVEEVDAEEVVKESPIEEAHNEAVIEPVVVTEEDAVIVDTKEQPEEKVSVVKPEEKKEETKKEKVIAKKQETFEKKEKTQPVKKEDGLGSSTQNKANNDGTAVNREIGDAGFKGGKDGGEKVLKKSYGGGNAVLDMPGWTWEEKPVISDQSSETGTLVLEIRIDEEGEVISVKPVKRSISRATTNIYIQAVKDLVFYPDVVGGVLQSETTGRITFVIKMK